MTKSFQGMIRRFQECVDKGVLSPMNSMRKNIVDIEMNEADFGVP